jgi:hypothetical protein
VASDDCEKEKVEDSGEEYFLVVERNFNRQTRQPKDHFEKVVDVTSPNHSYPIKHKLKDCSTMKNFMTLGAFTKGRKLEGDPGRKGTAPIPGQAEVMTIFD